MDGIKNDRRTLIIIGDSELHRRAVRVRAALALRPFSSLN